MKKKKCGLKVFQRSAKCKLPRTFTQTLFFIFSIIMPDKFTMKCEDESAELAKSLQKLVLKDISIKHLTSPNFKYGGIK